jgi:serine/threonine protein kinase
VDYGICKTLEGGNLRTRTQVGTDEYVSPEFVAGMDYGLQHDWWELGIFVWECLTGRRPFDAPPGTVPKKKKETVFHNIKSKPLVFPAHRNISLEGQNFIDRLLDKNCGTRMANNENTGMIKDHPWFKGVDWDELYKLKIQAPFKLKLKGP